MNVLKRYLSTLVVVGLVVGVSALGTAAALSASAPAAETTLARTAPVVTGVLPSVTCAAGGTARSFDLYAGSGTLGLAGGASVPIWGYSATAGPASLPGPTLVVCQGDSLSVTLHNNLSEPTSLQFTHQGLIPDTVGVAAGGSKTYTFTAAQPGTSLYEPEVIACPQANSCGDGGRQTAMGLFGTLIVRPSSCANCAYDASTTFDDEALLVLSELDPDLNNAPSAFDLHRFEPKYWLINGKSYPNTDLIPSALGDRLLLRYVNAGVQDHSMGLLGLHQQIVGIDSQKLNNPYHVVAETIAAGQTLDAISTLPRISSGKAFSFAVLNEAMHLDNNGPSVRPGIAIPYGGMLTFVTTTGSSAGTTVPQTSNVTLSPASTNGSAAVTLTAAISEPSTAGPPFLAAAEYFVDSIGVDGSGCAMTGLFGGLTANVSAAIPTSGSVAPCTDLSKLATGNHAFYVHGEDSTGAWGVAVSGVLSVDKTGPAITKAALTPSSTNGTVDVAINAIADDSASGNDNVMAADFFVDTAAAHGSGTRMTLATSQTGDPVPTIGISGTIPRASVAPLSEGVHHVLIEAQDALGNWTTPAASFALPIDRTGPNTSNVVVQPTPNNGNVPLNPNVFQVQINASMSDPPSNGLQSNVVAGEGFVDTVGANGSGVVMLPGTGSNFNSPNVTAYMQISLYSVQAYSEGPHMIYVHGQDAAGNWGPLATGTLVIDKTGPNVSNVTAAPNPTNGASSITLTATATDPFVHGLSSGSNIIAAEWFRGADPGAGNGTPMLASDGAFNSPSEGVTASINVTSWPAGSNTVSVRAEDAATNWGPPSSETVIVGQTASAPAISNVTATSITATGVTITWTTDVPSTSQVNYGATAAYGSNTPLNSTMLTSHSVTLSGLSPSTLYHYQASSGANSVTGVSADYTFTTAANSATLLVGSTTIQSNVDSNPAGRAEAFQYTASATGTARRIWIYVDAGSAATSVAVGVYSNTSSNNPGSRLTQATITNPVRGAWNSVVLTTAPALTNGSKYWIAVLGLGGTVQFRDTATGGLAQTSSQTTLAGLPLTWTSGTAYHNSPMSAYVTTN